MPMRHVGRQVTVVYHNAEWFNNSGRQRGQAGSYSMTATRRQRHGSPVRHHYRPSNAMTPHRTADRVQDDR
jgi:hypothetical protein